MSVDGTMWVLVIGFFLIATTVVGVIIDRDIRYPRPDIVTRRRDRDEHSDRRYPTVELPPARVYTHIAPARPPTVDQAHTITQQHRDCDTADCPRKMAAIRVLVKAGRMTLP